MTFVTHTHQAEATAYPATRPTGTESNNKGIHTTGISTQNTAPLSTVTESEEDIPLSNTNKDALATQPPSSPPPGTTHNGPTPRRTRPATRRLDRYHKETLPEDVPAVSLVPTKYPKAEPRPSNAPPPRIGLVDIADPRWAPHTLDTVACTTTPSPLDTPRASIVPRGDASGDAGARVLVNVLLVGALLSLLAAVVRGLLTPRGPDSGLDRARARRSHGVRGAREENGLRWKVSPPDIRMYHMEYDEMRSVSRVPGMSAPTLPVPGRTSALVSPVGLHRRHVSTSTAELYAGGGLMELEDGAGVMCGVGREEERELSTTTSRTMEDVAGVVGEGMDRVFRGVVRWTEKGVDEERGSLLPN